MGAKNTIDNLSQKERLALAHFYGTDSYNALVKFCQLEIDGLAKDALSAIHMDGINFLKGRASFAKELPQLLKAINESTEKS